MCMIIAQLIAPGGSWIDWIKCQQSINSIVLFISSTDSISYLCPCHVEASRVSPATKAIVHLQTNWACNPGLRIWRLLVPYNISIYSDAHDIDYFSFTFPRTQSLGGSALSVNATMGLEMETECIVSIYREFFIQIWWCLFVSCFFDANVEPFGY